MSLDAKVAAYVARVVERLKDDELPLGSCDCSECKERVVRAVLATYMEVVFGAFVPAQAADQTGDAGTAEPQA